MQARHFDAWREAYDRLSYADQKDFYDLVEVSHPVQSSFNLAAWEAFFEYLPLDHIEVFELGGWHGEMALSILARFATITSWTNWEISQKAASAPVCQDIRYRAVTPKDFAWNLELPTHNVFVASHVIEHIRLDEARRLFEGLPTGAYVGLEIPVGETGQSWEGYHGSHIIEGGWQDIEAILGRREIIEVRREYFRAYANA